MVLVNGLAVVLAFVAREVAKLFARLDGIGGRSPRTIASSALP
jgi:hypothetical protein